MRLFLLNCLLLNISFILNVLYTSLFYLCNFQRLRDRYISNECSIYNYSLSSNTTKLPNLEGRLHILYPFIFLMLMLLERMSLDSKQVSNEFFVSKRRKRTRSPCIRNQCVTGVRAAWHRSISVQPVQYFHGQVKHSTGRLLVAERNTRSQCTNLLKQSLVNQLLSYNL